MKDDHLIRIYSGTEVMVLMLQEMLEENDIGTMVRNDFQSGVAAGFVAGLPTSVDLYILEADLAGAESILAAFLEGNPEEQEKENILAKLQEKK
jgi:hypothetical protein